MRCSGRPDDCRAYRQLAGANLIDRAQPLAADKAQNPQSERLNELATLQVSQHRRSSALVAPLIAADTAARCAAVTETYWAWSVKFFDTRGQQKSLTSLRSERAGAGEAGGNRQTQCSGCAGEWTCCRRDWSWKTRTGEQQRQPAGNAGDAVQNLL